MTISAEDAAKALETYKPVYGVDGRPVWVDEIGIDDLLRPYVVSYYAAPDGEPGTVRETFDLWELHNRPQIATVIPANPCNCEHTNHFDDDFGPRVEGAHLLYEVPAGDRSARYVGPVCDACATTCMAAYLI